MKKQNQKRNTKKEKFKKNKGFPYKKGGANRANKKSRSKKKL